MSNMQERIAAMIVAIDANMGEGYTRKNPELLGRLLQAECMVMAATTIQDGLYFLGSDELDEEVMQ